MAGLRQTTYTRQAVEFSDTFGKIVGAEPIGGKAPYVVQMAKPEGMSTGRGVQAVQHVTLVPKDGSGVGIVIGSANRVAKTAEIRTYPFLLEQYRLRTSGADLPVEREAYDHLVERMGKFFAFYKMEVKHVEAEGPAAAPSAARKVPWIPIAVVGILALAAAVLMLWR